MRKKVCIIIDNPIRDLQGLILLSYFLVKKSMDVFLVPMSTQQWDIFIIKPDVVILNYIRPANCEFVKKYKGAGIKVGVLDTEGGVFVDIEQGFKNFVKNSYPENIDFYCTWGKKQKEILVNSGILSGNKVFVTGTPRYDMCVRPWRKALEKHNIEGEKVVLVNMRFPTIFPKFKRDLVVEYSDSLKEGVDKNYFSKAFRENMIVCARLIELVSESANKFPDYTFVVRPHPFERKDVYEVFFGDILNIKVIQEGDILGWLNSVDVIVQQGCTTGLEAKFMDTPVVEIDVAASKDNRSIDIAEIADVKVSNAEQLAEFIKKPVKKSFDENMVRDWFFDIDGKASQRISEVINKFLGENLSQISFYGLIRALTFKKVIVVIFSKIMGPKLYNIIKERVFQKKSGYDKCFFVKDVKDIFVRIISSVSDKQEYDISNCIGSFAVKVSKRG